MGGVGWLPVGVDGPLLRGLPDEVVDGVFDVVVRLYVVGVPPGDLPLDAFDGAGGAGVGAQVVMTVGNAIAQSIVPGRLLGRVMGLLWVAQGLAQSAGLFVGLIGQAIGLTVLYPLVGLLMIAVTAVTFVRSPLRSLS